MDHVALIEDAEKITSEEHTLTLEVAYATPDKQEIVLVNVPVGTTAREAVRQSPIKHEFPEIDVESVKLGVFGKLIAENYELHNGDRIELYRPLLADPKEVRRRLAAEGKTLGKKKPV
ncbi:MAG: RnfH family protein [Gammaproteobacteria bacterium]|nr:RnfH family protein [Gammaproteobacteria bacterium]NNM13298.1 RnfH family protein [Gammaproteobacteria bacterium]